MWSGFLFRPLSICLIYLEAPVLGACIFMIAVSSGWLTSSSMQWSFSSCYHFCLKVYFFSINVAISVLFWFPFARKSLGIPSCGTYVYSESWSGSQHTVESGVFIHSAFLGFLENAIHLYLEQFWQVKIYHGLLSGYFVVPLFLSSALVSFLSPLMIFHSGILLSPPLYILWINYRFLPCGYQGLPKTSYRYKIYINVYFTLITM